MFIMRMQCQSNAINHHCNCNFSQFRRFLPSLTGHAGFVPPRSKPGTLYAMGVIAVKQKTQMKAKRNNAKRLAQLLVLLSLTLHQAETRLLAEDSKTETQAASNSVEAAKEAEKSDSKTTESSGGSSAKVETQTASVSVGDSKESESSKTSGEKKETGAASEIQAKARPFGLNIVSPVKVGGSDSASAEFMKKELPAVTDLVNTRLSERVKVDDSAMLLDPSKLKLQTDSDVRVYFVGEGAGYRNTLGFNTSGSGVKSGNPELIFPDASSTVSTYDPAKSAKRTDSAPLLPGDFADLGRIKGGSLLNFFLVADGANGGKTVFSTDKSANPDGINHVVSFAYAVPGSSYLMLAFEDLFGGGDRDFNDVVVAVEVGARNIAALTGTPEPALTLTMGALVAAAVWTKKRRDRADQTAVPSLA